MPEQEENGMSERAISIVSQHRKEASSPFGFIPPLGLPMLATFEIRTTASELPIRCLSVVGDHPLGAVLRGWWNQLQNRVRDALPDIRKLTGGLVGFSHRFAGTTRVGLAKRLGGSVLTSTGLAGDIWVDTHPIQCRESSVGLATIDAQTQSS